MNNRLWEVMQLKRITQKELSKSTRIAQSELSKIINGQKDIYLTTAQKIAKALDHPIEYLWPY